MGGGGEPRADGRQYSSSSGSISSGVNFSQIADAAQQMEELKKQLGGVTAELKKLSEQDMTVRKIVANFEKIEEAAAGVRAGSGVAGAGYSGAKGYGAARAQA